MNVRLWIYMRARPIHTSAPPIA